MGYFSNGTEGMSYFEEYCEKCLHNCNGKPIWGAELKDNHHQEDGRGISTSPEETRGCPVWFAHQEHNYDECNNKDSILHKLIPRNEKGWNDKCLMFVDRRQKPRTTQLELIKGRR